MTRRFRYVTKTVRGGKRDAQRASAALAAAVQDELRALFASGTTSAVGELALSVLVLVKRTSVLIES